MNRYEKDPISVNEFVSIREKSEQFLEYIDGYVFMSPSPSKKHHQISGKLFIKLSHFLEGRDCEVFPVPFDIESEMKK